MSEQFNDAHIDGDGNIVVQGVNNSKIVINVANKEEIRLFLIKYQRLLEELPLNILETLKNHLKSEMQLEIKIGTDLQFNLLGDIHPNREFRKMKFGVTIINLTKENRYYNNVFFKVNPKFIFEKNVEMDTFTMMPQQQNVFPKKLEYGEPCTVTYEIKDGAYKSYEDVLKKDENAYVQAFCSTTVGELYESNKILIRQLFERLNWLKQ